MLELVSRNYGGRFAQPEAAYVVRDLWLSMLYLKGHVEDSGTLMSMLGYLKKPLKTIKTIKNH